jgi:hypothetical protein
MTVSPRPIAGRGRVQARALNPPVQLAVALVAAAPIGIAIAATAHRIDLASLVTFATSVVLCVPIVVAIGRMRSSLAAFAPVSLSLALAYFFVPRLLAFDPASGLLASAGLTPSEVSASKVRAQLVLVVFAVPVALVFRFARRSQPSGIDGKERQANRAAALRWRAAVALGIVAGLATLAIGLSQGVSSRGFDTSGGSSPTALLGFFGPPIPAALWLGNRRRASIALLPLQMAGPYLQGGRQSVLTPLVLLLFAMIAARRPTSDETRSRVVRRVGATAAILIVLLAVVAATTSKRTTVETAQNGGKAPSLAHSLIDNQTLLDPLVVAIAREPTPQLFGIYQRALAAPVPRLFWSQKPFSYDYDFRARHFPQFGDAIPVSVVGTSYLSFLLPGAALAGGLLAYLAVVAERLLQRTGLRPALFGGAVVLLSLDLLRIGGLYREVLTFTTSAICILAISKRTSPRLTPAAMSDAGALRPIAISEVAP